MDEKQIWQTIDSERAATADLLAGLTDVEWTYPSLCAGWTVREVAAHLSLAHRIRVGTTFKAFVRARGSFNRMVDQTARDEARRPAAELVAELRGAVGLHRLAPGQTLKNALMDTMVHTQDIALPLGIERHMPLDAAVVAADDLWRIGFPFHARRRLAGHRLVATDADWAVGEGAEISGPIEALVMLLAGRTATIPRLTGITV
ncbi:maleylpyruvate isomerase family mycothiol-dependent enzyme [Lentzea sp. BCCO 10_0061]|uniref:Maleylpyruvate isomerase family mycothiol-dependent enzyme n=1 Tax=Lentzea sokolovensis TaxID=3095429 RepID=A0ABU4UPL4_9PSEU|nr:maleylpyruvate isomerase family mycothiol-dependent enzyme [Lentzea sp. BCCO 10_0061]MDX8140763.1 maleylpyruvate isomerase family mycothiol-dependent enzyme [Lentzea sp. BCCO 10_0061]